MAKKQAAVKAAKKSSAKKSTKQAAAKKSPKASAAKKALPKKPAKSAKKPPLAKSAAAKVKIKAPSKAKVPAAKPSAAAPPVAAPPVVTAAPATAAPATTAVAGDSPKVVISPSFKGAPEKLGANSFPKNTSANDFRCYGPPATKDGEFSAVRICDMGCFTQDGKDSNKYYHAAVVQDKQTDNWFAYFEWGRTGASSPSFQFVACASEADARSTFAKQLSSKNDKRGEWATVAGIRTLRAKKGQDCYLVRPMATRSTGLPDARSIKANEGAKQQAKPASTGPKKKSDADPQTLKLLSDLAIATIAYTRGSMADASLPTQSSIDEARTILTEATTRLGKVGDDVKSQVKDKQLMQLTTLMYSRIPKRKPVGSAPETWILSKDNILMWQNDLDAFESALYATDIQEDDHEIDPLEDMKLKMEWISPESKDGKFLMKWWPAATANRHAYIGQMKIKNLWRVERLADDGKIPGSQKAVLADKPKIVERPLHQVEKRDDLSPADQKTYHATNTGLLFHGTRSVNVSGILREALRLPKQLVGVVITGAMFGPGLYFADDWKKSAGYTSLQNSYWSGGSGAVKGRDAFMFAADVVLGSPYVAPRCGGYTSPPKGHHCVFGKAGDSGVQNNEFIIYSPNQNRLRYLAEFTTTK